jgi:hypothetical protein
MDREKAPGKSIIEQIETGDIINTTILADTLPLCQQAAETTGYSVAVIAQPGQHYLGRGAEDLEGGYLLKEYKVLEGKLGISIGRPSPKVDHSAFWNELRRLQEAHTQSEQPLDGTS